MTEHFRDSAIQASIAKATLFTEKYVAKLEEENNIGWTIRSLDDLNKLFSTVLSPVDTIEQACDTAIALGAPPVAVRLMGFEDALRTLIERSQITEAITITLARQLDQQQKSDDEALGIVRVPGNVLHQSTWSNTHRELQARGHSHAGLVLWDPQAGLNTSYITDSVAVYNWLLAQAYELVSPNHGVLLAEIPLHLALHPEFDTWMQTMTELRVSFDSPLTPEGAVFSQSDWRTMKIVKTEENLTLPII